jgi:hypothetical protein
MIGSALYAYGFTIKDGTRQDLHIYKKYVIMFYYLFSF